MSHDNNAQSFIDINIDDNPYQHNIAAGKDSEFLRILCDVLDVGVSIFDENLDYQFISQSVIRQLEVTNEQLSVGDNLSNCHDLMMAKGLLTQEIMEENKLSVDEQSTSYGNDENNRPLIIKLTDGSTHKLTRKTLPNGYTVSMSHDVSELVEKDHLLTGALALGEAGYWIYDISSKTYELSSTLQMMLSQKYTDQIKEKGIFSAIHPEDRALAKTALKSAKQNKDKFEYTARAITYSGQYKWGNTVGEIIRDKSGKPVKIRAFVIDIEKDKRQAEELMKAKDEAIAASRAKSEFLANMSHEIRTPMNGILGMAELLANSDINERQRDFINVINNSASALLTIINDILDFSKIEAGAFKIDPTPFDLKTSLNDVVALLRSHAQEKELELIINYPINAGTKFIGDGGRLRQVITNLIGNAIKFTETGHIIIDIQITEPRDNIAFVTLNVTDTGIGIEAEKLKQVFQKFTQADGSTTRIYGGTGLGLSISKAIIEMMGGRMNARSVLGKGSTFTARIPLQVDPNAIETTYDTSILKGKRALIIDDIKVNRSLLTEQLASWNIKSDSVKNGVEAITQLKNQSEAGTPYDLILLDFLMPGLNGQELAAMITRTSDLSDIPIIMLSSCDQPISSQNLKTIGIDNYLVKPVREQRLYDTIVETLTPNPLEASHKSELDPSEESLEKPKQTKTEILVAEDFPLNREVIQLMLIETPYEPVFANNGLEAVQMYKAEPGRFSVIIMDVSMPVMDGHQATGLIQKFENDKGISPIPIIALTGHALKNDREECYEAGMCDYLTKPVKQSELLTKLDKWLNQNPTSVKSFSA